MEENFNPVAQTRANYYTPGSPVQFVCVELLRGEQSGEHAVCLTFKNISRVNLTALEIHFKCKGVDGVILCEDTFEYRDLDIQPGELFGMDDAVFVTPKAITSVDVSLKSVYNGKRVVHLEGIKRVRLPAPKRLGAELQAALEARMNRKGMKYLPQVLENGWYCACGAFHPKEEDTVYCSECGCDRILLQNALNTLLQPAAPARPAPEAPAPVEAQPPEQPPEEPTREVEPPAEPEEPTRVMPSREVEDYGFTPPPAAPRRAAPQEDLSQTRPMTPARPRAAAPVQAAKLAAPARRAVPARAQPLPERYDPSPEDEEDEDDRDSLADALIRWVPPVAAVLCAGIALWGFVYYQLFM